MSSLHGRTHRPVAGWSASAASTCPGSQTHGGNMSMIENWFIKIHLHFHADCTVKRRPKDALLFDYVFNFNKE